MDVCRAGAQAFHPATHRLKAAHAKAAGQGGPVQQPNAAVHGENGPANSIRVGAKVAQQHREQAAANPKQSLPHRGNWGCGVVRRP